MATVMKPQAAVLSQTLALFRSPSMKQPLPPQRQRHIASQNVTCEAGTRARKTYATPVLATLGRFERTTLQNASGNTVTDGGDA